MIMMVAYCSVFCNGAEIDSLSNWIDKFGVVSLHWHGPGDVIVIQAI